MNLRHFCATFGAAAFMVAASANATVHRVFPGESIQAAIDAAAPGDTILVEPGVYKNPDKSSKYGLRIATDNLRLIGKVIPGRREAGKVRIVYNDDGDQDSGTGQQTGIYAAPAGCDYKVSADSDLGLACAEKQVKGFYIRGFTVEDFPMNGIQTRWVDGFEFVQNESVRNRNNGIYPTLSANGLVQNNVSYGSLDTAMWVAGSENVRVIGNEVFDSVIGFEITVSNNVWVTQNKIHSNTLGIGLFHPNGAGNPPKPVMKNWVIEHNDVRDNNRPNDAPGGSFQSFLPPGIGILLAGVSDHVIAKNTVADNDFVGIAVLGWCAANAGTPNACPDPENPEDPPLPPLLADPAANNNLVAQNKVSGNGTSPPPIDIAFLAADITYFEVEGSSGNCFEKNKPSGFSFFSSEPPFSFAVFPFQSGPLPTDGCKKP
jgi:parallel beta-helix repeat protein